MISLFGFHFVEQTSMYLVIILSTYIHTHTLSKQGSSSKKQKKLVFIRRGHLLEAAKLKKPHLTSTWMKDTIIKNASYTTC